MKIRKFLFLLTVPLFAVLILPNQLFAQTKKPNGAVVVYHQKVQIRPKVGLVIKNDTLKYNRKKSIFQWHMFHSVQYALARYARKHPEKAAQVKMKQKALKGRDYTGAQTNLVNIAKDSIYSQRYLRIIRKWIYYKEKRPVIHWQFKDSTKMVGNYKVKKATTHFRGRDYIAWYTPKIPVPYGPWKLNGLPGLILQAYDKQGDFYFSAQKITFKNIPSIGPIHLNSLTKQISFAKYKNIMNHLNTYLKERISKQVRRVGKLVRNGRISQETANKIKRKVRSVKLPTLHALETFSDSDGNLK